ncbi:hypothetical protein SAMN05216259_10322 [Actinacidiphila guanduensis]|uniref:Uncharacterized protein n=1 Tax=Actinacidiphila guanduensis TaxID=310781 RepID=A0A1G9Z5K4_9ACTN|nr:hypothetical protein SAMN05216259_10322 [Actinacidiphila guanduensis]
MASPEPAFEAGRIGPLAGCESAGACARSTRSDTPVARRMSARAASRRERTGAPTVRTVMEISGRTKRVGIASGAVQAHCGLGGRSGDMSTDPRASWPPARQGRGPGIKTMRRGPPPIPTGADWATGSVAAGQGIRRLPGPGRIRRWAQWSGCCSDRWDLRQDALEPVCGDRVHAPDGATATHRRRDPRRSIASTAARQSVAGRSRTGHHIPRRRSAVGLRVRGSGEGRGKCEAACARGRCEREPPSNCRSQ